jgi:ABC-2 type transport system permease protein
VTPSILTEVGPLALRSVTRTLRQPPLVVAGIVFPLLLYGFNIGGLSVATKLPGFPTKSYATFALGLPLAYCGIYAVTVAGTQLGEDIRTGFLRRLSVTRLRSAALILGQLAGVLGFALVQAAIYLGVGFAAGAHVAAGAGGAFVIVGLCGLYALALGAVGQLAALRTGSGEAVQGLFPLLMASLFMSSVNLPRNLIHHGWFRDIATYNPVSYLVEAPRSLLVQGWNGEALALGFGAALGILVAALLLTATTLRGGAVRTVGGGGEPRKKRPEPGPDGDEGDQPAHATGERASRPGAPVRLRGAADFWTVTLGLARRQLVRIIKSPPLLLPALLFPLFLFAAFAGGLSSLNKAPNFGYYDYTAFQFVYVLFQASGAAGVQTGIAIAQDFESGFSRRLMLSSRGRLPLILGYALAALARAAVINVLLFGIALATGMSVDGSPVQLVGLFGLSLIFNLATSLLAAGTALRVRSLQAGPAIQVPMIVALFLVPVYAPRTLLVGWVHTVANVNPVTRLLEAGRGFMAGHDVSVPLAYGLGVGLVLLFSVWSLSGMRRAEAAGGAAAGRG